MDNYTKKVLLIIIGIMLSLFYYNQYGNQCPCKNRISYKNLNINAGISLENIFHPTDSIELAKIQKNYEIPIS